MAALGDPEKKGLSRQPRRSDGGAPTSARSPSSRTTGFLGTVGSVPTDRRAAVVPVLSAFRFHEHPRMSAERRGAEGLHENVPS